MAIPLTVSHFLFLVIRWFKKLSKLEQVAQYNRQLITAISLQNSRSHRSRKTEDIWIFKTCYPPFAASSAQSFKLVLKIVCIIRLSQWGYTISLESWTVYIDTIGKFSILLRYFFGKTRRLSKLVYTIILCLEQKHSIIINTLSVRMSKEQILLPQWESCYTFFLVL